MNKLISFRRGESILACAAYVDLNPIRAAMAETLERSDFTSVQRRIEAQQQRLGTDDNCAAVPENRSSVAESASPKVSSSSADRFISPLMIDETSDAPGSAVSPGGFRCSDKGFLPLPVAGYLELLDWTARN